MSPGAICLSPTFQETTKVKFPCVLLAFSTVINKRKGFTTDPEMRSPPVNTLHRMYMQSWTGTQGLNQHKLFLFTQETLYIFGVRPCGKVDIRSLCYCMVGEYTMYIAYIYETAWICVKKWDNTNALKPSNAKCFLFASEGLWKESCVKSKGL